jgi:energy-converting hydrogenase B subunit D
MIYYILLAALVLFAYLAVRSRDLLFSVIFLSVVSLSSALLFFLLSAPDIAMTEAAVNAGIVTLVYVIAIKKTRRQEE